MHGQRLVIRDSSIRLRLRTRDAPSRNSQECHFRYRKHGAPHLRGFICADSELLHEQSDYCLKADSTCGEMDSGERSSYRDHGRLCQRASNLDVGGWVLIGWVSQIVVAKYPALGVLVELILEERGFNLQLPSVYRIEVELHEDAQPSSVRQWDTVVPKPAHNVAKVEPTGAVLEEHTAIFAHDGER